MSRNPLFIKSEFSLKEIYGEVAKLSELSQSFIHQVGILSRSNLDVKVSCTRRVAGGRNPLFIKSEFSLFITSYADVEATLKRRNPLFIKSEFSQGKKGSLPNWGEHNVAILYSSSQNSLSS